MSGISPASSVLSTREKRVALAGPPMGPLRGANGILKGAGYQVATAEDLTSLERLESGVAPDLVIFDIAFPPEGGVAASRHLRARPFWKFVSMMLATPAGEPHLEEAHVPGINDFILAPFPADELLDKVRRLTVIPARRELNTVAKVRDGRPDGSTLFGKTLNGPLPPGLRHPLPGDAGEGPGADRDLRGRARAVGSPPSGDDLNAAV